MPVCAIVIRRARPLPDELAAKVAEPGPYRRRVDDLAALPAFVGGKQPPGSRKATPLFGGEEEPLADGQRRELLSEHTHLFLRVVELPLQPVVDRGGDHHDEELQRHRQHGW